MCLSNVQRRRPKTATEDIPCFKILRKDRKGFVTPYYYQRIKLGHSYTSVLESPDYCDDVEKGIHAFLTLEQAQLVAKTIPTDVIVKCIIPKGAKYYIGEYYRQFKNTAIAATEIKYGHKTLKSCV